MEYKSKKYADYLELWTKKEVDWVEEREGKLFGFEFKWSSKKTKPPKLWLDAYPEAVWKVIDRDNYLDFILD